MGFVNSNSNGRSLIVFAAPRQAANFARCNDLPALRGPAVAARRPGWRGRRNDGDTIVQEFH